ncbi:DUF342 domain-containing protein [Sulfuricurvum sp. IAE1]|jgi:hypothetical protein|uniref:flagellar assembly protein A n=1 Tax=Sulfuricurvum sp. IAE1 TaxID=2546102 RepID=UPI001048D937|nr:flagellar assembly protein A [Sulfuricurvum sp. IAE1]MDD3769310.1 FapA family protein [Sulfuricurvum sp.]MDX9965783.1 FapA family protein [Sulfuricurvum sp.]TDA69024.1 DUF342 domain-containing protein [Sulfuricurvum sp. IAE1]
MALFSKEGGEQPSDTQLKPIIVRTSNVAKELLQTAANAQCPVQTLDFNLLETQTFSRKDAKEHEGWNEMSDDEVRDIAEELFLDPGFELKQVHEIEIFQSVEKGPLDSIDMTIGGNPTLCKVYLTIKPGSVARYYDGFRQDFLQAVRKKMLRAHLMINVFDSMMAENLKELIARIRVQGTYTFEKPERYLIAQAYEPVPTVNDALVLHYEAKRKNQDEHGRIDYAKRGYVISAVADELLIEYVKPKIGENGRNCRGEFLTPPEPTVKNEPTFTVGEHIAVVDTPNSIEYRAKTGGYVTFEGGMYDIKTEVEVTEISFKTTGSINTELDADVSISVKEKDSLKDAIGQGMEVTVNVIHIDGSVGANAKVTANKADVEGQVHQSALIRAEELNINIHKGTAYGKTVHITRLEHGTVEADEVFITQAIGGKIKAKEITIEMLGSHVKMTASRKIEVKKLVGGENQFVIDPLINESVENLSERYEKMEQAKRTIQEVKKELAGYEQIWQENAASMEDLKRKLAHYRSNGVKLPTAFVQKYQQFVHLKEKIDALREELKTKEDQYDWLAQKHIALQSEIFDARIINHDGWHNHNEIIFKLINPQMNVNYVPHDEDDENILGLYQDADGEFSIKVMPE